MKKKIVYSLIFFSAIVLQTSVLSVICSKCAIGNIVLAMILAGVVLDGFLGFWRWAIFVGIVFDILSYSPIGVHALIFLLSIYFVSFFSQRFTVEIQGVGIALLAMLVGVATLILRIIPSIVNSSNLLLEKQYREFFGSPHEIALQIIFNFILFFGCLVVFKKIKKFYAL